MKNEKRKKTNTATEEADEIQRTCSGELAGGKEHTGVSGSGKQNISEEDRRQAEAPETDEGIEWKRYEKGDKSRCWGNKNGEPLVTILRFYSDKGITAFIL